MLVLGLTLLCVDVWWGVLVDEVRWELSTPLHSGVDVVVVVQHGGVVVHVVWNVGWRGRH